MTTREPLPHDISAAEFEGLCHGINELREKLVSTAATFSHHTCTALNKNNVFCAQDVNNEEMFSIVLALRELPVVLLINEKNFQTFNWLNVLLGCHYYEYSLTWKQHTPPLNIPCLIITGGRIDRTKRVKSRYWRGITIGYRNESQGYPDIEVYLLDLGFTACLKREDVFRLTLPKTSDDEGSAPWFKWPKFDRPPDFLTNQAAFEKWFCLPASLIQDKTQIDLKWNRFSTDGRTQVFIQSQAADGLQTRVSI